jgi:hypothetical protein
VDPTQAQDPPICIVFDQCREEGHRQSASIPSVLSRRRAASLSCFIGAWRRNESAKQCGINEVISSIPRLMPTKTFQLLQMSPRPDKASISFSSFGGCKGKGDTSRDLAQVCKQTLTSLLGIRQKGGWRPIDFSARVSKSRPWRMYSTECLYKTVHSLGAQCESFNKYWE